MPERLTNQKQIILDYLKSTHSHPSAEDVFKAVKKKLPRVSLGTVYRNLENFVSKNILEELSGKTKRFDADLTEHHHFVCERCNNIFDLDTLPIDILSLKKQAKPLGIFSKYKIFIYGICNNCKK